MQCTCISFMLMRLRFTQILNMTGACCHSFILTILLFRLLFSPLRLNYKINLSIFHCFLWKDFFPLGRKGITSSTLDQPRFIDPALRQSSVRSITTSICCSCGCAIAFISRSLWDLSSIRCSFVFLLV